MVTVSLLAMIGLVGLTVDLGWMYFVKKSAQAAADAAALGGTKWVLHNVSNGSDMYTCNMGSGALACATASPCTNSTGPAADSVSAACMSAAANGFSEGGSGGRQGVKVDAGVTPTPPTVPGVTNAEYWVTVRVAQQVPQLFSAVFGNMSGTSAARATAMVANRIAPGSIYSLNRENDPVPNVGVNIDVQGNSTIDASGAIYMASAANGAGLSEYAGSAGGTADVIGSEIDIRGGGTVDNPGNFHPTPQNGLPDGDPFQDPMRGKGQPPAPTGLPTFPVPGGDMSRVAGVSTTGGCQELQPGNYYAAPACPTGNNCSTTATGGRLTFDGCFKLSGGASGFGDYVLFGGVDFTGNSTDVTFSPGRYIYAGVRAGDPVFYKSNKAYLHDNTPLDGAGHSVPNTDAGELFILTDANYPGLQVPAEVQPIQSQLGFGHVDIQTGNNAGANLHGLNKGALPMAVDNLSTFAPVLFWQDQRNSRVQYDSRGNIDTTSCGSGHSINNPCPNPNGGTASDWDFQAHPELQLYGVIYQPRGAQITWTGNGTVNAPLQIITGALILQGGPNLTLTRVNNPLSRRVAALVE
jgi:hypothetical protein